MEKVAVTQVEVARLGDVELHTTLCFAVGMCDDWDSQPWNLVGIIAMRAVIRDMAYTLLSGNYCISLLIETESGSRLVSHKAPSLFRCLALVALDVYGALVA